MHTPNANKTTHTVGGSGMLFFAREGGGHSHHDPRTHNNNNNNNNNSSGPASNDRGTTPKLFLPTQQLVSPSTLGFSQPLAVATAVARDNGIRAIFKPFQTVVPSKLKKMWT
jgi:hypothetical protein